MREPREPSDTERETIRDDVLDLAWTWGRRLTDLGAGPPYSVHDAGLDDTTLRAAYAARHTALELVAAIATRAAADDARWAGLPPAVSGPVAVWTREDIVAFLTEAGTPAEADTWSGYVSRGQAPAPVRRIGRTPVWDPEQVRAWQAARRGRGWRVRTGAADQPTTAPARDTTAPSQSAAPAPPRRASRSRAYRRLAADLATELGRRVDIEPHQSGRDRYWQIDWQDGPTQDRMRTLVAERAAAAGLDPADVTRPALRLWRSEGERAMLALMLAARREDPQAELREWEVRDTRWERAEDPDRLDPATATAVDTLLAAAGGSRYRAGDLISQVPPADVHAWITTLTTTPTDTAAVTPLRRPGR